MKASRIVWTAAILVLVVVAVVLLVRWRTSTGVGEESRVQPQRPRIRVSVNSWVGFGPLYVARAHGYFDIAGIDVDVVRIEGGPDRRAALAADRVDILGSSFDDFAVSVDRGIDALAIACADFSNGGDGILVGRGISTLSDLIKTNIAVQPGLPNHFFLLYALDKAGISTRGLKLTPMLPDDAGAAFIAGKINAAVTWEPHLSRALKERPDAKVLVRSNEYPEAILDLFIANREWVSRNADTISAFRAGWDMAVAQMARDQAQTSGVLARELGLQPAEITEMLSGVRILTNQNCRELVEPQLTALSDTVERLWRDAGFVEHDIDLAPRVRLD